MELKTRKRLAIAVFLLVVIGFAAATGYLKSQTGPIVFIPNDNQVLPNVTDTVKLGAKATGGARSTARKRTWATR